MLRLQNRVIQEVIKWLKQNKSCWLATITSTYGSSPRPVGSMMACNSEGEVVGSISGGCIEEDLIKKVLNSSRYQQRPQWLSYRQDKEASTKHTLPCGGEIKMLVEPLSPQHLHHFESIERASLQRTCIQRIVNISSGDMEILPATGAAFDVTEQELRYSLMPDTQLLVIGIAPVSLYVAEMANSLDFSVTLCDPRTTFQQHWNPEEYPFLEFSDQLPDDLIRNGFHDCHSAIVALAHDPRVDDMALMEALTNDAFYVGAMGSQKTSEERKQRLIDLGTSSKLISKLHAPIGLPIGSKTPMEIAISIVAHLVLVRSETINKNKATSHGLSD